MHLQEVYATAILGSFQEKVVLKSTEREEQIR